MTRPTVASGSQEQEAQPRRRRRRRSSPRPDPGAKVGARRRRLRVFYFALASIWGFLIGTAAMLAALAILDQPISAHPLLVALLLFASLLALAGGVVTAAAYREAAGRGQH